MAIKIAINGFGRIGRAFLKVAQEHPELEVVGVNDLGDIQNFAYLLKTLEQIKYISTKI